MVVSHFLGNTLQNVVSEEKKKDTPVYSEYSTDNDSIGLRPNADEAAAAGLQNRKYREGRNCGERFIRYSSTSTPAKVE
jgi:hypothetical protein